TSSSTPPCDSSSWCSGMIRLTSVFSSALRVSNCACVSGWSRAVLGVPGEGVIEDLQGVVGFSEGFEKRRGHGAGQSTQGQPCRDLRHQRAETRRQSGEDPSGATGPSKRSSSSV